MSLEGELFGFQREPKEREERELNTAVVRIDNLLIPFLLFFEFGAGGLLSIDKYTP